MTSKLQQYLDIHRADYEAIKAPFHSQPLYRLREGKEGMEVQWSKGAGWVMAPDDLAEQIMSPFTRLGLIGVQYLPGLVQFMPRMPAHKYKGRSVSFLVVHSVEAQGVPECTEAVLLGQDEFGHCWLPMRPPNWYMDFTWTYTENERAAYEGSDK